MKRPQFPHPPPPTTLLIPQCLRPSGSGGGGYLSEKIYRRGGRAGGCSRAFAIKEKTLKNQKTFTSLFLSFYSSPVKILGSEAVKRGGACSKVTTTIRFLPLSLKKVFHTFLPLQKKSTLQVPILHFSSPPHLQFEVLGGRVFSLVAPLPPIYSHLYPFSILLTNARTRQVEILIWGDPVG